MIGLNTGTIRGYKLPLLEQIDVTAKAGYGAIEPWIGDIDGYVKQGGLLKDARKRIDDAGLKVSSAIGFARWAVDDDATRAEGLEEMKQAMGQVAELGGAYIAASPAGINRTLGVDLFAIAERYRAVLELGDEMGVIPQVEIWGSAQTLGRVGEAALVAMHAGHPQACILLDAYQIYRGGSPFEGIEQLKRRQDGELPHQRLSRGAVARRAQRLTPRFSGRRYLPFEECSADALQDGIPRRPFPGDLQPHVLGKV